MKQRIILASNSSGRKELLKQIGLDFEVIPSDYEENMNLKLSNNQLAKTLAMGKAEDVAHKIKKGIVIASDTFAVSQGKRIGKPKNKADAKKILKEISGKKVKIYSGIAVIDVSKNKKITDCEITDVKIKKLTPKEINGYIKTGEPLDKAGAFAIQGMGAVLIEKINGCHSNVIGLPLRNLYRNLKKLQIDIFD